MDYRHNQGRLTAELGPQRNDAAVLGWRASSGADPQARITGWAQRVLNRDISRSARRQASTSSSQRLAYVAQEGVVSVIALKNAAVGRVWSGPGGQVFGKGLGCIAYRVSS
jgi:hypothetical protein